MKVGDLVKLKFPKRDLTSHGRTGVIIEMEKDGRNALLRVHWAASQDTNWVESKQIEVINERRSN